MLSVEKSEDAIQRYTLLGIEETDKRDFYFTLAHKALEIKYRILKQPMPNGIVGVPVYEEEPVFECILPKELINGI
ncbi:MAG: hypothetical protein ACOC80_11445 [Petrotogales bacterium]